MSRMPPAVWDPNTYVNPMADSNFGPLFDQYRVTYGRALEFVNWNYYDTVTYTSATTLTLSVFDGSRNVTTNRFLCNLPGNTLPDRQGFLVMGLQFIPGIAFMPTTTPATATLQTGAVDDLFKLSYNGIFELRLYDKLYAQLPLIMMPAACGVVPALCQASTTLTTQYANNGVADARNLYTMEEPVFIPPLVQIQGLMAWNGAQTIANGNPPLKMNLGGLIVRPVQ